MVYFACITLFLIGIYCIIVKKNLIKIIIGLFIIEYAVTLFIVAAGYKIGAYSPIIAEKMALTYVDPLPQAFAIVIILVGLSSLMLLSAIAMRLYERYGTLDINEIRKLKG